MPLTQGSPAVECKNPQRTADRADPLTPVMGPADPGHGSWISNAFRRFLWGTWTEQSEHTLMFLQWYAEARKRTKSQFIPCWVTHQFTCGVSIYKRLSSPPTTIAVSRHSFKLGRLISQDPLLIFLLFWQSQWFHIIIYVFILGDQTSPFARQMWSLSWSMFSMDIYKEPHVVKTMS